MKIFTARIFILFLGGLFFAAAAQAQTGLQKPADSPEDLAQYEGRYEVNPLQYHNFIIDVAAENDALVLQLSHRQKRRFSRVAPDKFSDAENAKISLTFARGKDRKISGLTLANIRMTYYSDASSNITSRMVAGENKAEAKKIEIPPPAISGNTVFTLKGFPNARVVALAGSFNNWNQTENICRKEADGWSCRIDLAPGKHTYKFVVDGAWMLDPENEKSENDGNGIFNSVLIVKPDENR